MNRPYLIFAPQYTLLSGGVRILHTLCHWLNEAGEKAWLAPPTAGYYRTNPNLNAQILTQETQEFYMSEGIDPIFVYPDIVKGNPCQAKRVVRYLLAKPGDFGGETNFPETDIIWSLSGNIAANTRSPGNVLCIPVTDTTIFTPGAVPRKGACFFSNKYDRIHGHQLLPITNGAVRLSGYAHEMAAIMQASEICYVYENSLASIEAPLCGCPTVLVKTDYFFESWLHGEYGWAGVRWSDQDIAREPINKSFENYEKVENDAIGTDLHRFITETQDG